MKMRTDRVSRRRVSKALQRVTALLLCSGIVVSMLLQSASASSAQPASTGTSIGGSHDAAQQMEDSANATKLASEQMIGEPMHGNGVPMIVWVIVAIASLVFSAVMATRERRRNKNTETSVE